MSMFPIIASGSFSGQGSTAKPNASAAGSVTAGIQNSRLLNLANAYDGDSITTFAEVSNTGCGTTSSIETQEVIYTHAPNTGLTASSFMNLVLALRVTAYMPTAITNYPSISLIATLSGNYSDATPIISTSNPLTIVSASSSQIKAGPYSLSFNGNMQIPFDQFAPKTIDIYSLSLSIKWVFNPAGAVVVVPTNSVFDARIYDISYIYL